MLLTASYGLLIVNKLDRDDKRQQATIVDMRVSQNSEPPKISPEGNQLLATLKRLVTCDTDRYSLNPPNPMTHNNPGVVMLLGTRDHKKG